MKRKIFSLFCLAFAFLLCSCTDGGGKKSDFAYYFALDKDESENVLLYAVMKDGEKTEDNIFLEKIEGDDINRVYTDFFDKFKDVYTGTVKEYAVSETLGEKGMTDFKTYLTNSPKLPAKRKTVSIKNAENYIGEKTAEEKEKFERKNEKD